MAQDIRELLKDSEKSNRYKMPQGHRKRFEARLDTALSRRRKRPYGWLKIAASIAVIVSAGYFSYRFFMSNGPVTGDHPIVDTQDNMPAEQITLGDISPELKKVEDYYMANINVALSELDVNGENKQLFNSYMNRLTELNDEYQKLNKELNDLGPNEQTINALIDNLQLRLQLLYKLKQKLNELNNVKNEKINKQEQV